MFLLLMDCWQDLAVCIALNHIIDDGWMVSKQKGIRKKHGKKSLSKSNCYMIDRLLVIYWKREEKSDMEVPR